MKTLETILGELSEKNKYFSHTELCNAGLTVAQANIILDIQNPQELFEPLEGFQYSQEGDDWPCTD